MPIETWNGKATKEEMIPLMALSSVVWDCLNTSRIILAVNTRVRKMPSGLPAFLFLLKRYPAKRIRNTTR